MPRRVEIAIETTATPDQVWRAITEPEEISAWFAPEAKVVPGPGGSMTFAWDSEMQFTTPITAWEPGKRLQSGEDREKDGQNFPIRIDYFIETANGATTLRMVHSGFGDTADWDNEIAGYEDGWGMFMAILAHRLKHAGESVCQALVYRYIQVPRAEAWAKLTGENGIIRLDAPGHFALGTDVGTIEFEKPNFFRGLLPGVNDALLSIFCEGGKASMITVTLMLFGASGDQAPARRADFTAALDRLFPA